jgi:outer membrane beta-barrel protein
MKTRTFAGAVAVFGMSLYATSALAQFRPSSQDLQLYAGEMFGDRLTRRSFSGNYPQLDDSFTFGGRYTFNFTPQWGLQLAAGYTPSRVSRIASGTSDFGLTTTDLDVIWNITPDFSLADHRLVTYAVAGAGYAWADLSGGPLSGSVRGIPLVSKDGNGVTGNAGFGVKYYVNEQFFIDLDARYRYLNNLVSSYGQGLNTVETTLSVGYQF